MDTIDNYKKPKFKCPDCKNRYTSMGFLLNHVKLEHGDKIKDGMTPKQYCFNRRNKKAANICDHFAPRRWENNINRKIIAIFGRNQTGRLG